MGVQPVPIMVRLETGLASQTLLWRGVAILERVFAAVLLVGTLPLTFAVALATMGLSGRSPLIAHYRVGKERRPIWILKLRTMWTGWSFPSRRVLCVERLAPENGCTIEIKSQQDPRVTSRFAAKCRRYSLDELPQLWHVLTGDMAIVGPRPLTAHELQVHYEAVADELLSLKPGLTGLWQISGRSRLSYSQRRRLDLFMVRNWSFKLYLMILIRTVPTVLGGRDAW